MRTKCLQTKTFSVLGAVCFGISFVICACGQNKPAETPANAATRKTQSQKDDENKQLAGQCDFSSYSTIQATPIITKQVKSAYPKTKTKRKTTGIVKVKVLINREGKVEQACAVEGSKLLIPAALAAAKLWEFSADDIQKNLERMKREYFESIIVFRMTPK